MILIEKGGDRQLVHSLVGYPGWVTVAENVAPPPHNHCRWEGGRWVEDAEAKRAADEEARLRGLGPAEFMAEAIRRARGP